MELVTQITFVEKERTPEFDAAMVNRWTNLQKQS